MITWCKLQSFMWALGMPTTEAEAKNFAGVYRSAIKAGMTAHQATAMVRLSYNTVKGYTWEISRDAGILEHHVKTENARKNPNHKDAAELAGRPWI